MRNPCVQWRKSMLPMISAHVECACPPGLNFKAFFDVANDFLLFIYIILKYQNSKALSNDTIQKHCNAITFVLKELFTLND